MNNNLDCGAHRNIGQEIFPEKNEAQSIEIPTMPFSEKGKLFQKSTATKD